MTALPSVRDLPLAGRRVFLRSDLNVPMNEGRIEDDARIRASLPTMQWLVQQGASVVVASHLGRPQGRRDERYSLAPVAKRLAELLGRPVAFVDDVAGELARSRSQALGPGEVLMLQNLRFEPGEERDDPELARRLAQLADLYVNDAFGAAHRAHASTHALADLLPHAAGLLLLEEVRVLTGLLENPQRPFVCILGGAKVSDKLPVLRSLLPRVDRLLLGGGMANTFFLAQGLSMGRSLVEPPQAGEARALLEAYPQRIELPRDLVVALSPTDAPRTVAPDRVGAEDRALDVGSATVDAYAQVIASAGCVFWNGPVGLFEQPPFDRGTLGIARAVAQAPGFTVAGGGDSLAALDRAGVLERIDHASTGGGASLELLEGRTLPGVAALVDRHG